MMGKIVLFQGKFLHVMHDEQYVIIH